MVNVYCWKYLNLLIGELKIHEVFVVMQQKGTFLNYILGFKKTIYASVYLAYKRNSIYEI